jgi:hypothetical protein
MTGAPPPCCWLTMLSGISFVRSFARSLGGQGHCFTSTDPHTVPAWYGWPTAYGRVSLAKSESEFVRVARWSCMCVCVCRSVGSSSSSSSSSRSSACWVSEMEEEGGGGAPTQTRERGHTPPTNNHHPIQGFPEKCGSRFPLGSRSQIRPSRVSTNNSGPKARRHPRPIFISL